MPATVKRAQGARPGPARIARTVALALLAVGGAAHPAEPDAAQGCVVVFGQGRNLSAAEAPTWDRLNLAFNAQVARTLESTGRRIFTLVLPVSALDPRGAPEAPLRVAVEEGCATIVETAIYSDDETATLFVHLRVHPVLPVADARTGITGLRVGVELFESQRNYPLSKTRLDRLDPAALAIEMATEYAEHDRR